MVCVAADAWGQVCWVSWSAVCRASQMWLILDQKSEELQFGFLIPDSDVIFCCGLETPSKPPGDGTWLLVPKCPILHIFRRMMWTSAETLFSLLQFFSPINLGLSILPLDKVLVFCETEILNWGGNLCLSWEMTQDAIRTCFADGKIGKPWLSEKYMVSAQWRSWQKVKCSCFSPHGWFLSICTLHSLCVLCFPLGL